VGLGGLARHDDLQAREKAVGGGAAVLDAGVKKHQYPPLCVCRTDELPGPPGPGFQISPMPDVGRCFADRFRDQGSFLHLPQRG